jgi:hypothetical protein
MGRPPGCNCRCASGSCNPAFSDPFTSLLPSYTLKQSIFSDPFGHGPIVLNASGGVLSVVGNPDEEAEWLLYQTMSLQSGLRHVYVEVSLQQPTTVNCDQGLFIGLTGPVFPGTGQTIFELTAFWGAAGPPNYVLACLKSGGGVNEVGLSGTPTNGDRVRLAITETSAGVFTVAGSVNGSLAGTITGATPPAFSSPVAMGIFDLTIESPGEGHGVDSWAPFGAPLVISCV